MTHEEAERACKRLAAEHPDRESHRWVPHDAGDGNWDIAKISLAPSEDDSLAAETRADERPPTPDHSRTLPDLPYDQI